jgi:two-component system response regulator YesN
MLRVVIAEDEMLVRAGLRNAIRWEQFGMEVIADVANGLEALQVYRTQSPDIIITDLKMPVMSGLELISEIRSGDPHTKIIIITCLEEFDIVRKVVHYGVSEYMLKLTMTPNDMEDVLQKVALEIKKGTSQLPLTPSINESLLVERLFKDYMFRHFYTAGELEGILRQMNSPLTDRSLQCVLIETGRFDKLKAKFKDENGDLVKFSLLNIVNEIIRPYKRGEVIHYEHNRFLLLLTFQDLVSEQKREQTLNEMLSAIRISLRELYHVPVIFAASSVRNGFAQLQMLCKEAACRMENVFVLGAEAPLTLSNAAISQQVKDKLVEHLHALLLGSKPFKNESFTAELAKKIERYLAQPESAASGRKRLNQLLVQFIQLPFIFFRLHDEKLQELSLLAQEEMEHCDTLTEAIHVYQSYMEELAAHYYQNLRRVSPEINEAVRYLNENYNRELPLKELARAVAISPNYLSSLFAQEMGQTIVEYIHHLRIDKAKALLADNRLKFYEVAAQVGFTDHTYFSKVFKKTTGMGPREYVRRLYDHEEG